MDKKKIIKEILIFLMIVVILILLENAIRGTAKVTEHVKNSFELKKEQAAYEASQEYVIDSFIDKSVKEVLDYIKSGDYKTLYSLLDPTYKDFKQIKSEEDLKAQIDSYFGNFDTVSLMSYVESFGKYSCSISVSENGSMSVKDIVISENSDGSYSVMLDNIISLTTSDATSNYVDNNISFKMLYEGKYSGYKVYSVEVKNVGNKVIEGSFEDTYIYRTDRKMYKSEANDSLNIKLAPAETTRVNFIIKNRESIAYAEDLYIDVALKNNSGSIISGQTIVIQEEYFE